MRFSVLCLLSSVLCAAAGCGAGEPAPVGASLAVAEALAGDTAGYARAVVPRPFVWPDDHGPHPDFRTEWWYYTGNVRATDGSGRRFGYQLTVFRTALAPPPDGGGVADTAASAWATRQLYMAHVAVSDLDGRRFHHTQSFERGAVGLAGATAAPLRVWLGPTEIREAPGATVGGMPVVRLAGRTDDGAALALTLAPLRPPVLQGDRGLSRKGPEPGNASFYYSVTRLGTTGTVTLDGDEIPVEGLSWLDREWSTSALGAGVAGWDWFALHLDDGRDLMLYRLRRTDGTADPFSRATLVRADGTVAPLAFGAFTLTPEGAWESPRGGIYPARWRVRVPGEGLDLRVVPAFADQELDAAVRYWEGAVRITGSATGRGYLEMTGYADAVGATARPAEE